MPGPGSVSHMATSTPSTVFPTLLKILRVVILSFYTLKCSKKKSFFFVKRTFSFTDTWFGCNTCSDYIYLLWDNHEDILVSLRNSIHAMRRLDLETDGAFWIGHELIIKSSFMKYSIIHRIPFALSCQLILPLIQI